MKTFIIGAGGYVGGSLADRLRRDGDQVVGLARTPASAAELESRGHVAVLGTITDVDVLAETAADCDAVVWAVFPDRMEEYGDFAGGLLGLYDVLAGTGRPLLYLGGGFVFADTGTAPADEQWPIDSVDPMASRAVDLEGLVLSGAGRGIRAMVTRPSLVFGHNAGQFVRGQIDAAARAGEAIYVGSGEQLMSTIHIDDLCDLHVRALHDGPAGSVFNASSEEPVTTMDLATAYARVAAVDRVSSVELGEAVERFGFFGRIMSKTMWISSQKARDLLGWAPQGPPLFDDLFVGSYATLNVAG